MIKINIVPNGPLDPNNTLSSISVNKNTQEILSVLLQISKNIKKNPKKFF